LRLVARHPTPPHELEVFHEIREDFPYLLRQALGKHCVAVALGPIYETDPAAHIYAPYVRSAREAGWTNMLEEEGFAPQWAEEEAMGLRLSSVQAFLDSHGDLGEVDRWTRAGLVLEIASRWGVPMSSGGRLPVDWKLKGTVTGRFGVKEGSLFNPMTVPRKDRARIAAPRGRYLATIDFRAMDVCSMVAVVPGLAAKYEGAEDPHARTAELVGLTDRDTAKKEVFVYAYGGESAHAAAFDKALPEIRAFTCKMAHGDFPRLVQSASAKGFRAGLSRALPLLVTGDVRPLFTVHDELTLEIDRAVANQGLEDTVAQAMALGASELLGVRYGTKVTRGNNYEESKKES
jgi:hypothetical protein